MSTFEDWGCRAEYSANSTPPHSPLSGPHPKKQMASLSHQVISPNRCNVELDQKNSELVEVPLTSDEENESLVDLREQRLNPYEAICLSADQNMFPTNWNNHFPGLNEVLPPFRPSSSENSPSPIRSQPSINVTGELKKKFYGQGSSLSSNSDAESLSPVVLTSPGRPPHNARARSPSFTESCDDLKFNEKLATELRDQCSLLSPSVVRAITSDIEDIKRSLTGPITLPDLLPVAGQGGCRDNGAPCKQFSPEHHVSYSWTDSPVHNSAENQLLLSEKLLTFPEKGLLKGRRKGIKER